jgi:hypothetical protein
VKISQAAPHKLWRKTPVPNAVRYVPSRVLFARIRVKGKLIRRSLKAQVPSVGRLHPADLEQAEREAAEYSAGYQEGKTAFADALAIYRSSRGYSNTLRWWIVNQPSQANEAGVIQTTKVGTSVGLSSSSFTECPLRFQFQA